MKDEEKKELFKHSETLKENALKLFEGQGYIHTVFGLLHAAAQIIKENKESISYENAVMETSIILLHLGECSGCERPKEKASE